MKMHGIIVKQGFAVIVSFSYSFCLFKTPVITILKVIVCEDCVRENKLSLWEPGHKAPSRWAILQFFRKKTVILTPFGEILNVFRPIRKYGKLL